MKTRARLLLTLTVSAAILSLLSGCIVPSSQVAYSHPVTSVERFGQTLATRGDSMSNVRTSLGPPLRELSPNVWAYPDFHGGMAQDPRDDSSILIVMFTEGHVSDLRLINHRAQAIIAAQLSEMNAQRLRIANR